MMGVGVYLEFRMNFEKGMNEWFGKPSSIIAICFSYSFMRVVEPVEAGRPFMYDSKYNEERHVTGMYLRRIAVEDTI